MTKLEDPGRLLIRKSGNEIQTLCRFNGDKNIFNRFVDGNNLSFFLPPDAPFEAWQNGELFHEGWDDLAPIMTAQYAFVGANHGSPFAYSVTMIRHWYFERDIGKVFTDDAGNRFILVQIINLGVFIVHSDIVPDQTPCFNGLQGSLYDNGKKLNAEIKKIQLGHARSDQLPAHFRFNRVELTADGVPVPENEIVNCSSATLDWEIDLCLADALLEHIKANPGKFTSPTAPELRPAIRMKYSIVFRPDNSCTVDCDAVFMQDFAGMVKFGLLQHYGTIGFAVQEKFIPGLKPIELEYDSGETVTLDLNTPTAITGRPKINLQVFKSACIDPENPPLRYIDIFGNGKERQLGVVLGYSATRGITAKGSLRRGDCILTLPYSNKIYPYAFYQIGVAKGERFQLSAFRQYFDPASGVFELPFPGE